MYSVIFRRLFVVAFIALFSSVAAANTYPFTTQVRGKGSPVIFIPGYTCSGDVWKATVEKFSATHECHVLTIRGFGGEAASEKEIHLVDVKEGIKKYIHDKHLKQVVLVGHSMGGFLALWIATELKEPLAGVVIVDALPFIGAMQDSTAQAKGFDSTAAKSMESMLLQQTSEQRLQSGFYAGRSLCADTNWTETIARWSAVSDPHTAATLLMDMAGTDLRKDMAKIQVPVLALVAWEPIYGVPQEMIKAVWQQQYRLTPHLDIQMAVPSRHFIMYDASAFFYTQLTSFLDRSVKHN